MSLIKFEVDPGWMVIYQGSNSSPVAVVNTVGSTETYTLGVDYVWPGKLGIKIVETLIGVSPADGQTALALLKKPTSVYSGTFVQK